MNKFYDQKSIIIENLVKIIKKKYPTRTEETYKCYRDLTLIYDAIINDCIEKDNYHVSLIANKFWYMNKRQIINFDIEFEIYDELKKQLSEIEGADITHISQSIDILKSIIEKGPNEVQTDSLNSAANSARRCQRNWNYSKLVENKHIVSLLDIAVTMPSKQAREYFEVIVSTNQDLNNEIRKNSIDTDSNFHPSWQNNQMSAPVLFIWITSAETTKELNNKKLIKHGNNLNTDGQQAVGISAGAVALSANYLGYKTGFCRCFDGPTVQNLIENKLDKGFGKILLMLGIGYPDNNLLYNQCYDDEGNLRQINGRPRHVRYYRI
jgi:nitroreductase